MAQPNQDCKLDIKVVDEFLDSISILRLTEAFHNLQSSKILLGCLEDNLEISYRLDKEELIERMYYLFTLYQEQFSKCSKVLEEEISYTQEAVYSLRRELKKVVEP